MSGSGGALCEIWSVADTGRAPAPRTHTTAQAQDHRGGRYLVKTATTTDALSGDVEGNRQLSAVGLPVPVIVDYRDGWPSVLILRWIDGDPLTSTSPDEAQREVGRLLRTVHMLPSGPPFSGQPTIASWIAAWTAEVLNWWPPAGADRRQTSWTRDWLRDLEPVLARRTGSLTLFDGRAEHFLVKGGRLAGVVDLHDVGSGDPAMNLAVGLTDEALIPGVLDGYLDAGQDDDLQNLIPFYLLIRRLARAEWQLRTGSRSEGQRLLQLAHNSLRRLL